MLNKISISKNYLDLLERKSKNNSGPKSLWEYLALKAIRELRATGHEKWIKKCYRVNSKIAETSKILALEVPPEAVRNCRGAIFTDNFKRLLANSKNSSPSQKSDALQCLLARFPFMSRYLVPPKL